LAFAAGQVPAVHDSVGIRTGRVVASGLDLNSRDELSVIDVRQYGHDDRGPSATVRAREHAAAGNACA
jgi:hypothetical protein